MSQRHGPSPGIPVPSGTTMALAPWVSEYEVAAVLRERGKPPVAYMVDADRNYVGGAFISGLNRDMRERLWQRATSKAGPPAKGLNNETRS